MKKSEYIEKQMKERGFGPGFYRSKVEREDVAAAEAAGVVWDPEEAPLPERIWPWQGSETAYLTPSPRDSRAALTMHQAREVARRYNAWEELKHLATRVETGTYS